MNNTNKKILVFASKYVGRETLKYLIENKTPIDHVIVANDYDREILELSIKNNISTEIYSKKTQLKLVEEDKKYEWLLNLWCPHILKRETLDIAKHRLNLHPSLVPHCRGNDNAAWAIRKELPAGVSLIEMDEDVDVGYLYAQREIKYAFPIRGKELHQILQDEVIELFRQNWPEIFREEIVAVPQAGTESLHTRKMTEKDRVRTWTERESIKDLCMWILAHDFYPNTTAEMDINGMRYKLTINIENINDK